MHDEMSCGRTTESANTLENSRRAQGNRPRQNSQACQSKPCQNLHNSRNVSVAMPLLGDRSESDNRGSRRSSVVGLLAIALSLLAGSTACDNYSELKQEMSASELQSFTAGQRAATACWSCHDLTGDAIKLGPPLQNFIGREIGTAPGYAYSDAFHDSKLVWNETNLDFFLLDVANFVPGTRMISGGVPDANTRAHLIFFLSKVTPK